MCEAVFAVETICNHIFCGNCLFTYYTHQNTWRKIQCPMCRQEVDLLFSRFSMR
eukprot:Pgem_evm1s17453